MATTLAGKITTLLERQHLLTAPEMLVRLKHNGKHYNKTSVYRALDKLVEQGELTRQAFGTKDIFFRLRTDSNDYVVCTQCGKLSAIERQLKKPVPISDFTIDFHQTTFYGLCDECQKLGE